MSEAAHAETPVAASVPGALTRQPLHAPNWEAVAMLRLPVAVELPLRSFRVRDLLQLRRGTVLRSSYRSSDALPLRAREQVLASVEFEVTDGQLHARITELA